VGRRVVKCVDTLHFQNRKERIMFLKKTDIIKIIFYITIALYFIFSAITVTMAEEISIIALVAKLTRYVCYVSFMFIVACNIIDFSKSLTIKNIISSFWLYMKKHLILVVVILVTMLILVSARNRAPLIIVLMIWACSFYDFKKIISLYFKVMSGVMCFTWGLSLLNLVPEIIITRGERQRFSLGFIYPLETMTFFLFLVICYIYLKGKDFTIKDLGLINVIAYLMFAVTDARTSYLLVVFMSIVAFVYAKTNVEKLLDHINVKVYYVCLSILVLGILGCGYFYNPDSIFSVKLDSILNNRVRLMNEAFNTYGVSLFGENIYWVGYGGLNDISVVENSYNYVDCAYAKMLFDYGVVFSIFVCVGYAFMYKYATKRKDYILILAVTMILIVSIMEPRLISIEMNPFVLLLSVFFIKENKSNFKFIL